MDIEQELTSLNFARFSKVKGSLWEKLLLLWHQHDKTETAPDEQEMMDEELAQAAGGLNINAGKSPGQIFFV